MMGTWVPCSPAAGTQHRSATRWQPRNRSNMARTAAPAVSSDAASSWPCWKRRSAGPRPANRSSWWSAARREPGRPLSWAAAPARPPSPARGDSAPPPADLASYGLPRVPVTSALRQIVGYVGADTLRRAMPGADALLALLPEHSAGTVKADRLARIYELFAALLQRFGTDHPAVLVIDDLH